MNYTTGITHNTGTIENDVKKIVNDTINYVGKDIVLGVTLALGKPVKILNEFYRRAKEDPELSLKIITALSLEKPQGKSELEARFVRDLNERIFGGVPDFDYMKDFRNGTLPPNVHIYEFYCKAGSNLNNRYYQMNHLANHYTHVPRCAKALKCNVGTMLLACREIEGKRIYSAACNPDITLESHANLTEAREKGEKVAIIAEANKNMPFMYGDAVMHPEDFDAILHGEDYNYPLFAPPKDPVALTDHMIGLNVSPLVKDGGTIQVGIGALGDAIVAGLIMRNEHNREYYEILESSGLLQRNRDLIRNWGETGTFNKGLYGASEMFVDPFMQMYKNKILKRKVYDSAPLMELLNSGELKEDHISENIIETLIEMKAIHSTLNQEDFEHLSYFGILKPGLEFKDGDIIDGEKVYSSKLHDETNLKAIRNILGSRLLNGQVLLAAFFLGPKSFYQALNDMTEEERSQFGMAGVGKVNQLYGDETLRSLQRKEGRFINAGMKATLFGAVIADQLDNGAVVSGVGGQYNFNAMAHALPDGRFILMIKSTKGSGKSLESNIVFSYGSCTIPKHSRDIIVTEYGIADIRDMPESEVIKRMLNIADSRFQKQLMEQAKKAGKIEPDYQIPAEYRNNYPEKISALLKPYQDRGYFTPFPFGTDLTDDDVALGSSLKMMKALGESSKVRMFTGLIAEFFRPVPQSAERHLERMELDKPASFREKLYRKMVVFALRNNGKL
ncbi:MAG TPA: acetyl-CoA hydrolase/transferase C-terminal domain-containing protein [Spirochaetota bacterium]|nr:acetyl-CoA hydrolase/transferase C-terminal domain-containing protein [Spirochaetota bacterium]HPJ34214.1 acetyl-CoA hydrolase/transferase C-terminal domain-containing protein [Spirochaetota bacterium]